MPPSTTSDPVLTSENLRPLLSEKTKFVACTHTSNVLGTIHNIKAIADAVHEVPGAMLCVDGVAYAPHREVDVKALGVDFYAFSWYKVRSVVHTLSLYHQYHWISRNLLQYALHPWPPNVSLPTTSMYRTHSISESGITSSISLCFSAIARSTGVTVSTYSGNSAAPVTSF